MTEEARSGAYQPDVTVTFSYEEAWLVYGLLVARFDNLTFKEEEAMYSLGAARYGVPSRKVQAAITEAKRG